jgi:predicted XRE-type DNA-binding protein
MPRVHPEGPRSRERRAVAHRAEEDARAGWRLKARLAVAVNEVLEIRRLKQREAAVLLGVPQPRVSALRNYRLDRFSVERLMEFLTSLGQDVDIRIRPHKRHGAASRDPEPAAPAGAPGRVSVHKG